MSTKEDNLMRQIARAIRGRREQLGLTLRTLADKSGVSSSMISDIERGAKSPTLTTLSSVAAALGLSLAALVEGPRQKSGPIYVARASTRRSSVDRTSGSIREVFGPTMVGSKVEFLRYVVPPGAVAGPFAAHAGGTIERLYVAAGAIRFQLGAHSALLANGDSCTCLADSPHSFDNREGNVDALLYLVIESPDR